MKFINEFLVYCKVCKNKVNVIFVLDVSQDVNRLAVLSRCAFFGVADRMRYNEMKEYELDDLTCGGLPHEYVFAFPVILGGGQWKELIDLTVNRLVSFLPKVNRESFPSLTSVESLVSYDAVRERKKKKLGFKFIKVEKV